MWLSLEKAPHEALKMTFRWCPHCQIISVRDHSFGLICYKATVTKGSRRNFPPLYYCFPNGHPKTLTSVCARLLLQTFQN